MRAIILAAGRGTRLNRYTEGLPKGMLPFAGTTLIGRQIEQYRRLGVDGVSVCTGFAADRIRYGGVTYHHNPDWASTNMVETLMCARSEFGDDVVVSYSDVVVEDRVLEGTMSCGADFAVAVDDDWERYWLARYGRTDFDTESLSIGEGGLVRELGREDPDPADIDARYIGVLRFSREGLARACALLDRARAEPGGGPWGASGRPVRQAYMTDLLGELIGAGEDVRAVRFSGGWLELDTNEDYERALSWVEDGTVSRFVHLG